MLERDRESRQCEVGSSSLKVKSESNCSVVSDCDPMNCSPLGSSVHGIFQERILGWYPFSSPGGFPDPGIESGFPALQADSLLSESSRKH